jgi:hypothetical protein
MLTPSSRKLFVTAAVLVTSCWLVPAGQADQCRRSCKSSKHVCTLQAATTFAACVRGCGSGTSAQLCKRACRSTRAGARATCKTTPADCVTSCPSPSSSSDTCAAGCATDAQTCFNNVLATGKTCVQACVSAGETGIETCLEQCAGQLRSGGAACLASLQGCLAGCQGQTSGVCFDTMTMQCTADSCGPEQPCALPNEFCSPRCSPLPVSGTCFDPTTAQCGQSCSPTQPCPANDVCLPQCPPPPPSG